MNSKTTLAGRTKELTVDVMVGDLIVGYTVHEFTCTVQYQLNGLLFSETDIASIIDNRKYKLHKIIEMK